MVVCFLAHYWSSVSFSLCCCQICSLAHICGWLVPQAASEQQGTKDADFHVELHSLASLPDDYLTLQTVFRFAGAAQVLHHEGPYEGTMSAEQEPPAPPLKPSSYLECGSGWLQQDELYW